MITHEEISKHANTCRVRPQQIEKDYIISWILSCISNNPLLSKNLIFKGGTCLKKIHIEDYRYSEDMDFTLRNDAIADADIYDAFNQVFGLIAAEANIKLSIPEASWDVHQATGSIKFYIDYVGPLGGKGDHIKVGITRGEAIEFDCVAGKVFNAYSDLKEKDEYTIQSYDLKEVLIEKMVALMGRTVPRDLYDFIYLTSTRGMNIHDVFIKFQNKAKHKGHNPDKFVEKVLSKEATLKHSWEGNLRHQIKDLQEFKDAWREFNKQIRIIQDIK